MFQITLGEHISVENAIRLGLDNLATLVVSIAAIWLRAKASLKRNQEVQYSIALTIVKIIDI